MSNTFDIKVQNLSGEVLRKKSAETTGGKWRNNDTEFPPDEIGAGRTAVWASENTTVVTGTAGNAVYVSDSGEWSFTWDNPFIGSNQFMVLTPAGFGQTYGSIGGINASVKVVLTPPED